MSEREGRNLFSRQSPPPTTEHPLNPAIPQQTQGPLYPYTPPIDNATTNAPILLPSIDTIRPNNTTAVDTLRAPAEQRASPAVTERLPAIINRKIAIPKHTIPRASGNIPIPIPNVPMKKSKKGAGPSNERRKNKITVVKAQLESTRSTIETLARNIEALEAENQAMRELLANPPNEQQNQHR